MICEGQFAGQFSFSGLTFAALFGVGILSGFLLWFWLGVGWGYRIFGISTVESSTERIVLAWSLVIPASLLIVFPSLSVLTILYLLGYLEFFPITFFSVFVIILGFFVMWALMNTTQIEEAIRIYPKPVIMLTMIGLFSLTVVVVLYLIYASVSSWQRLLWTQFFISPLTWFLLIKTIPIQILPEAGRMTLHSGALLMIYFLMGAITYMYFYYEYVKSKEEVGKQGKIVIMSAGEDIMIKWRELKEEFSGLKGEIWASLPYLDETSLEILEMIPKEAKVRIITGVVKEKFREKIKELHHHNLSVLQISKVSERDGKKEHSPVIHDRIVAVSYTHLTLPTN